MKISFSLIWLLFFFLQHPADAQFHKIKTINTPYNIAFATIDRVGELYLLSDKGRVEKIGVDGDVMASASLKNTPTLFDPRDGSHLFVYDRRSQEYIFLLPALYSNQPPVKIDSAFAVAPYLVCPSGEYELIILDSADWSLKKLNRKTNTLLHETIIIDSVAVAPQILYMREYQNFIFLLDSKKGILIFNMMGKLLRTISGKEIHYFSFLGEELYYLENDTLHFFDLFNEETRSMKIPSISEFAFITDERLYLISRNKAEIFSLGEK
jgi:hypothetical protein